MKTSIQAELDAYLTKQDYDAKMKKKEYGLFGKFTEAMSSLHDEEPTGSATMETVFDVDSTSTYETELLRGALMSLKELNIPFAVFFSILAANMPDFLKMTYNELVSKFNSDKSLAGTWTDNTAKMTSSLADQRSAIWQELSVLLYETETKRLDFIDKMGHAVERNIDGSPKVNMDPGAGWRTGVQMRAPMEMPKPSAPAAWSTVKGLFLPEPTNLGDFIGSAPKIDAPEVKIVKKPVTWFSTHLEKDLDDKIKEIKAVEDLRKSTRPAARQKPKGTAQENFRGLPTGRTSGERRVVRRSDVPVDPKILDIIKDNSTEFRDLLKVYLEDGKTISEFINEKAFESMAEEIKFIVFEPEMMRKMLAAMAVNQGRDRKTFAYDILVICNLARAFGSKINAAKLNKMSEKGRAIVQIVKDAYEIQFTYSGTPAPKVVTALKAALCFPSHHVLAGKNARSFVLEDILPIQLQCQSGIVFIIGNEMYNYMYYAMEFDRQVNARKKKQAKDTERFRRILALLQITMNNRAKTLTKDSRLSVRKVLGLPEASAAGWAKNFEWFKEQYPWVEENSKQTIANFISKTA